MFVDGADEHAEIALREWGRRDFFKHRDEDGCVRWAVIGARRQQGLDRVGKSRGRIRSCFAKKVVLPVARTVEGLNVAASVEGAVSCEALVEQDAQREEVRARTAVPAQGVFRGHVGEVLFAWQPADPDKPAARAEPRDPNRGRRRHRAVVRDPPQGPLPGPASHQSGGLRGRPLLLAAYVTEPDRRSDRGAQKVKTSHNVSSPLTDKSGFRFFQQADVEEATELSADGDRRRRGDRS